MKNKLNSEKVFRLLIIFLTSFLLGIIFSFYIAKNINERLLKNEIEGNNINKKSLNIISKLNNNLNNNLNIDKFLEVYNIIEKDFYSDNPINKSKIIEGAIKGMVESLGDKHSEYLTKEEEEKFKEVLSGDFEGIGAVVDKSPLGVKIERIIKGSPAKKYGLLKGDIIIEANGIKLKELNLYDSVEKIKGASGTLVVLKIIREGEKEIIEKKVIRGKIKIPSIDYKKIKNSNLGYISINMFGETTDIGFEKAIEKLKDTKGIIIDLRDNGGGYLKVAVNILSNLIEKDKNLVYTKYKKFYENTVYKSINTGNIYNGKIIVIINGNSASASEITAGALKDHNKAIIIGEKSYGKGSVQIPFEISGGGMLKLTRAKWFTPKNKNIDKEGIDPDIKIKFKKEDYENKYDRQLEKSKEILKEFIKLGSLKLTIDKYKKNY